MSGMVTMRTRKLRTCFQCHSKKVVGAAEWAVLVLFFWQLQSQRHWHWWWHSAADKRFPEWRPLWRPKWRCAQSSTATTSNRKAAYRRSCRRHGTARVVPSCWERRLESKRVRIQQCCRRLTRLLLITNGFQMTLKSMTLDDLERTMVCQSCGIVATR